MNVLFEDKTLTCRDCSNAFTWTAGEQQFYKEKQLINIPARCPKCRSARKGKLGLADRQMTEVVCAECGQTTTVPFVPRNGNPVYCSGCYDKQKQDDREDARGADSTVIRSRS